MAYVRAYARLGEPVRFGLLRPCVMLERWTEGMHAPVAGFDPRLSGDASHICA